MIEDIELSDIKRVEMREIDGSMNVRYYACVNKTHWIVHQTDGIFYPHITLHQWKELAYIKAKNNESYD